MDESSSNEIEEGKEIVEKEKAAWKKQPEGNQPTWLVVAVGLVMLVFGLFMGYFGRPLVGPEAKAAKATEIAQAAAVETQVAANQQMMEYLIGKLRHFQGDPNAPVTIIEFSDFQ